MNVLEKKGCKMKKHEVINAGRAERLLTTKRHHFLNPWFDDIFESRWSDDFFIEDVSSFDGKEHFSMHENNIDEIRKDYTDHIDLPGSYNKNQFE